MSEEKIPVVWIGYQLQLPADRAGERVGKTVARVLKHNFGARHVRVQLCDGKRVVSGHVEKRHLESIRAAVRMVMGARAMHGGLIRDPKTARAFENLPATRQLAKEPSDASGEQSATQSDGHCGAPSGGALQAQPEPAADEPPAVA